MDEVREELAMLARSLIKRIRLDLTSDVEEDDDRSLNGEEEQQVSEDDHETSRRWIAYPQTLRLTTRPRPLGPPLNPDGTRPRTFNRISRSCNMPSMIFNLTSNVEILAEKLVNDTLIPLFHQLHPERLGWNLSLVNLCAANMSLVAADNKDRVGRDIGKMFRRQENRLKHWKIEDMDIGLYDDDTRSQQIELSTHAPIEHDTITTSLQKDHRYGSEDAGLSTQESHHDDAWDSEDYALDLGDTCKICSAVMPPFAMIAHERFHAMPD